MAAVSSDNLLIMCSWLDDSVESTSPRPLSVQPRRPWQAMHLSLDVSQVPQGAHTRTPMKLIGQGTART